VSLPNKIKPAGFLARPMCPGVSFVERTKNTDRDNTAPVPGGVTAIQAI